MCIVVFCSHVPFCGHSIYSLLNAPDILMSLMCTLSTIASIENFCCVIIFINVIDMSVGVEKYV